MSLPTPAREHPNKTHGMTNSRIFKIWMGMHARCKYPSATGYKNYGGKGILVCERWSTFEKFYEDMGDAPVGMSIDRIDSYGNYEPSNCKWSTKSEQNKNQRDIKIFTHDGKSQTLSAWAVQAGTTYSTLRARVIGGWDFQKAISKPIREHKEYSKGAV